MEGAEEGGGEGEGVGGGEGVVLVEYNASESEPPELLPVEVADVGDGDVGEGEVGVLGDDLGEGGDARWVEALAQGLLHP